MPASSQASWCGHELLGDERPHRVAEQLVLVLEEGPLHGCDGNAMASRRRRPAGCRRGRDDRAVRVGGRPGAGGPGGEQRASTTRRGRSGSRASGRRPRRRSSTWTGSQRRRRSGWTSGSPGPSDGAVGRVRVRLLARGRPGGCTLARPRRRRAPPAAGVGRALAHGPGRGGTGRRSHRGHRRGRAGQRADRRPSARRRASPRTWSGRAEPHRGRARSIAMRCWSAGARPARPPRATRSSPTTAVPHRRRWRATSSRAREVMNDAPRPEGHGRVALTPSRSCARSRRRAPPRHQDWWNVGVRHDATGELVGLTELYLPADRPWMAFQGDTGVRPDHRGHGLGAWMKAVNHLRLADERPGRRVGADVERREQRADAADQPGPRLRARCSGSRTGTGRSRRYPDATYEGELGEPG